MSKVDPDELALLEKYLLNAPKNNQHIAGLNQTHLNVYTVYYIHRSLLTKRDELSFLSVLALPNASMAGFASMIWSSRVPWEGKCPVILFNFLQFTFNFVKHNVAAYFFFLQLKLTPVLVAGPCCKRIRWEACECLIIWSVTEWCVHKQKGKHHNQLEN